METEGNYTGEFLLSEAPGYASREAITIDKDKTLLPGSVLGQITLGDQTVKAGTFVGKGDGSFGTITAAGGAEAGEWEIRCVAAATNGGTFEVITPSGELDGVAKV